MISVIFHNFIITWYFQRVPFQRVQILGKTRTVIYAEVTFKIILIARWDRMKGERERERWKTTGLSQWNNDDGLEVTTYFLRLVTHCPSSAFVRWIIYGGERLHCFAYSATALRPRTHARRALHDARTHARMHPSKPDAALAPPAQSTRFPATCPAAIAPRVSVPRQTSSNSSASNAAGEGISKTDP